MISIALIREKQRTPVWCFEKKKVSISPWMWTGKHISLESTRSHPVTWEKLFWDCGYHMEEGRGQRKTRKQSQRPVMLWTLFPPSLNNSKVLLSQQWCGWIRDRPNWIWDSGGWRPLPHSCCHQQRIIMLIRRVISCRESYLVRQRQGRSRETSPSIQVEEP